MLKATTLSATWKVFVYESRGVPEPVEVEDSAELAQTLQNAVGELEDELLVTLGDLSRFSDPLTH